MMRNLIRPARGTRKGLALLLVLATCHVQATPRVELQRGAELWPAVCAEAAGIQLRRRVFGVMAEARDADCITLARAMGSLNRDVALAQRLLAGFSGPLQLTPEVRWLKGRAALASGQAQAAFDGLRPDVGGWPGEPYTLWDLAVAATTVGDEAVAREAYRRLLQSTVVGQRARIAMKLELAALDSRRGDDGIGDARGLVSLIAWEDTDPETCPWVAMMERYLVELQPTLMQGREFPCSREGSWARWVRSHDGTRAVFATVPRGQDWLRLPRNERLALVALGLGATASDLRWRLWDAVESSEGSALEALKRRKRARLKVVH